MIKFAGVCTLIPTPEVADFLSRYLDQGRARNFYAPGNGPEVGGSAPVVPNLNWQKVFHPQINTLIWPTGASRWASMLLLVTKTQLEDIKQLTDLTTSGITRAIGKQLVIADADFQGTPADDDFTRETIEGDPGNRVAISTEMFALEARPVSLPYRWDGEAWVESTEQTLWLLPIVDKRWFGQWTNVGAPSSWTEWSSVIDNTGINIVGSVDVSAIHADYQSPLDTLATKLKNANGCAVSDAVAHLVGQRVVRRIDGTIKSLTPTAAETAWDNNFTGDGSDSFCVWQRIAGGDYTDKHKAAATLPEKIRVIYPDDSAVVTVDDSGATQWGPSNTVYTVFADVDLSSGASAKDDFATKFAEDYVKWQKRKGDITFAGIKAWRLTGFEDVVIWAASPVTGVTTRVITHPENLAMIPIGGSSETCTRSYDLRLLWDPEAADMSIDVKYNDVTETIDVAIDDDETDVKTAVDAHSEFVAAGVHCTAESAGGFPHSNILLTLPSGATIVDHAATLTTRDGNPTPEFRVDICNCAGA